MSQATQQLHFPVLPHLIEEAERGGEMYPFRMRGRGLDVLLIDGEPWFAARNIGEILGLVNVRASVALLDEDERGVHTVDTPSGQQEVSIVSEAGLYSLIMRSRVPAARAFKRWVMHEVLPAIRKTGRYALRDGFDTPKTFADALELAAKQQRALEGVREERDRMEKALTAVKSKVQAHDALLSTDRDWSMRDAAAILNRDPFIWKNHRLGQNILFMLLRQMGMVDNSNRIYANHKQHLRLLPTTYQHPHTGEPRASEQLRVTPLGLVYLQKRLGGGKPAVLELDTPPVTV